MLDVTLYAKSLKHVYRNDFKNWIFESVQVAQNPTFEVV